MRRKILGILSSLIFTTCSIAGDTNYRPKTVDDLVKLYQLEANKHLLEAAKYLSYAAEIKEATRCPCYDVTVSTTPTTNNLIKIQKEDCKKHK